MIKGLLFFLVLFAKPADAHLNFDLKPEFDDSHTSEWILMHLEVLRYLICRRLQFSL